MNKFCKVLAVILAVLMLVGMATACKKSDAEDDLGVLNSGNTGIGGTNDDSSGESDGGSGAEGNGGSTNNGGSTDNSGSTNNGGSTNNDGSNNAGSNNSGSTQAPATQDEVVKEYDSTKKYDMANNPLVAETKKINYGTEVSYDIDTTGFVKNNIKLADLKGKTLTLITAIMYNTFQYKNEKGEYVGEWLWWESLKDAYGLNVKYIKSRFDKSVSQSLTYMNAGKALDVIPTHVGGFPKFLCLSQPLDPYINIQNIGNSPGVDQMTLDETKWGGTYRCISAIGAVNVIWYNQTMVEQMGLKDPHTTWQKGEWNWNAWEAFVKSVPATTPEGKALNAYGQCNVDVVYSWGLTNGIHHIKIDTESKEPNLINNWMDPKTIAAWEFVSGVFKSIKYGGSVWDVYGGGTMMADCTGLMDKWDEVEYTEGKKFNWVPFPKATTSTGRDIAFNYGYTMMLPKKMKNQSNAPYAVKFMELWANRFTEAIFDYFETTKCIGMDYAAKKEYFEFVVKNTYFGIQMNEWDMLTGDSATQKNQWLKSFSNAQFNVTTETTAMKNIVEQALKDCLAYGS
ncbi:MAG: hypothetical protein IJ043_08680 [Clostridia bacterium]|nr:hypothetical protein [Clostridia bacterium]